MRCLRALLPLVILGALLGASGGVHAGEDRVAPERGLFRPPTASVSAVLLDESATTLAELALAGLDQRDTEGAASGRAWGRRALRLLGDRGVRAAWTHLASDEVTRDAVPHLLRILTGARHPDTPIVFLDAANAKRPLIRMLAAEGLAYGSHPEIAMTLDRLARDASSGVRAAALRSLFARSEPAARDVRIALPPDPDDTILAQRLTWHRLLGDATPALRDMMLALRASPRSHHVRWEAAAALAQPSLGADVATLRSIATELRPIPGAGWLRHGRVPAWPSSSDPVRRRRIAVEALLTLLTHKDTPKDERQKLLVEAIDWVAASTPMDGTRRDPIPEDRLLRQLPELGTQIAPLVATRLTQGAFRRTQDGVRLLHALGADAGGGWVRMLLHARTFALPSRLSSELTGEALHAMGRWGVVGTRMEVESLLRSGLPMEIKEDLIFRLGDQEDTWVVEVLESYLDIPRGIGPLRDAARRALERRGDSASRDVLFRDLRTNGLRPGESPDLRIPALLQPLDSTTWLVLAYALNEGGKARGEQLFVGQTMVLAALDALTMRRSLKHQEGLRLVREQAKIAKRPAHVQAVLRAFLRQAPVEAAQLVKERWPTFDDRERAVALGQLRDVRGEAAGRAAIDLALDLGIDHPDPYVRRAAAHVLTGRRGHRDAEVEAHWRQLLAQEEEGARQLALQRIDYRGAPDLTDILLPLLEVSLRDGKRPDGVSEIDLLTRTQLLLAALRHQPWAKIRDAILRVIQDPLVAPDLRLTATEIAREQMGNTGREALITWWLDASAGASGSIAEQELQNHVATAVAREASPATAQRLVARLREVVRSYFEGESAERVRPDSEAPLEEHVGALAIAIQRCGHAPAIREMVDLLFTPAFGVYADARIRESSRRIAHGSVGSSMRDTAPVQRRMMLTEGQRSLVHAAARGMVYGLRGADPALLHEIVDETLARHTATGRLAAFPPLYLERLARALADTSTPHPAREAAAALREAAIRMAGPENPARFELEKRRVARLAADGQMDRAVKAQAAIVRWHLLTGTEGLLGASLHLARARLDAYRAHAHVLAGDAPRARDAFRAALMHGPSDPDVLTEVALRRAAAKFGLAEAERLMAHVVALEERTRHQPRLETIEAQATVMLAAGHPTLAIDVLAPRIASKRRKDHAHAWLVLARAQARAGRLSPCGRSLLRALHAEPGLESIIREDPAFEVLRKPGRLDMVFRRAAAERK